jgi:predicted Zn-dependent protease with MMP-like domain
LIEDNAVISAQDRAWFDEQLDRVVAELPPLVTNLFHDVPMIVDDFPSPGICQRAGIEYREELLGLYVGSSLDEKSVDASGEPSDQVYLFREGIFMAATNRRGKITGERLREEIRKTILHEYGHHHGMDEDELEALGY